MANSNRNEKFENFNLLTVNAKRAAAAAQCKLWAGVPGKVAAALGFGTKVVMVVETRSAILVTSWPFVISVFENAMEYYPPAAYIKENQQTNSRARIFKQFITRNRALENNGKKALENKKIQLAHHQSSINSIASNLRSKNLLRWKSSDATWNAQSFPHLWDLPRHGQRDRLERLNQNASNRHLQKPTLLDTAQYPSDRTVWSYRRVTVLKHSKSDSSVEH